MKNVFVETENVQRFEDKLRKLEKRGAAEACLMVVDGRPGLGKTTALNRWAVHNNCIYLRAKKEWTPGWFLNDLLNELHVNPAYSFQKKFAQAVEALLSRQNSLVLQKKTFAVVVDEADHISRNSKIMETIRDFSDLGDIPFILVGMGKIRDNLVAFPQVASRIAQYCKFEEATLQDVQNFIAKQSDVAVAHCLTEFIHRVTGGYNREIKEAIATVETFGRRSQATADNPVTLKAMAGQFLVNDRRTGQPVIVPEGVK